MVYLKFSPCNLKDKQMFKGKPLVQTVSPPVISSALCLSMVFCWLGTCFPGVVTLHWHLYMAMTCWEYRVTMTKGNLSSCWFFFSCVKIKSVSKSYLELSKVQAFLKSKILYLSKPYNLSSTTEWTKIIGEHPGITWIFQKALNI